LSSFNADPLTLLIIGWGICAAVMSLDKRRLAVAIGVGLYLAYTVVIGGDFMNGRFFTVPFLCALILLCTSGLFSNPSIWPLALVLLVGFASPDPPLFSNAEYGQETKNVIDMRGVADERAFYYPTTGLLRASRKAPPPTHEWVETGRRLRDEGTHVIITRSIGILGFYAGPGVWVVDTPGLADPLLARLPIRDPLIWRVGHYRRDVPPGYEDTLKSGQNQIVDPAIAALYDQLVLITRGPLFDGARLKAIWKMNLARDG